MSKLLSQCNAFQNSDIKQHIRRNNFNRSVGETGIQAQEFNIQNETNDETKRSQN